MKRPTPRVGQTAQTVRRCHRRMKADARVARRSAQTILVDRLARGADVDAATIADEAMHSLGEVIVVGDHQAALRVRVIVALERRRRLMTPRDA